MIRLGKILAVSTIALAAPLAVAATTAQPANAQAYVAPAYPYGYAYNPYYAYPAYGYGYPSYGYAPYVGVGIGLGGYYGWHGGGYYHGYRGWHGGGGHGGGGHWHRR